jgi:hypothetical protein
MPSTLMANLSRKQERDVAADLHGRPVPASGAFWSRKGDARSDEYLVEAKRTDKASLSIKRAVWDKIRREALLDGRTPVLALQIQDRNLAVLDWEDFLALTERGLGEGQLS